MSELKITGNPTPTVGKAEFYSVNQLLSSSIPTKIFDGSKPNPFEYPVEWSVHILENGKWIQKEENDKTGNKVSYTFIQKSLDRKGIRILAKRGNQVARLDIKPHKAESPKIESIEFLDRNGNKPTKPFAYGQTLKARVHCLHMEKRTVYATLWEDDAAGAGHNKANEKNKMKTLPGTVKGGIADIDFVLEPDFAKIANAIKAKGDADEGKTHEYYVTAEILNKKIASKNTNVANLGDKAATAKPATPKKETPAQKKGPSKKQEKEKEKEKSIGDGIIDWLEGKIKINPIVLPNPIDIINGIAKIFTPDKKKEDEKKEVKGTCERCKVLSAEEITKVFTGATQEEKDKLRKAFNEANTKFGLDTCQQKAHFFAQVLQEIGVSINVSDGEVFNYKVDDLPNHFKRFSATNRLRGAPNALAYQYGRRDLHRNNDGLIQKANKEMIANIAYANREGNGDFASGDGWKYRGRGIIQITFKDKYSKINNRIISDFPEFGIYIDANNINNLHEGTIASMAYWKEYGCQKVAKKGFSRTQLDAIVDIVNSSTPSRNNRWTNLQNCIDIFKVNQCKK